MSDEPATLGDLADVEANMRDYVKRRIDQAEARIEERVRELADLLARAEVVLQYEARLARVEALDRMVTGDLDVLRSVALWALRQRGEPEEKP